MPGFSDLIKFYLIEDVSSPLWLIIYENMYNINIPCNLWNRFTPNFHGEESLSTLLSFLVLQVSHALGNSQLFKSYKRKKEISSMRVKKV